MTYHKMTTVSGHKAGYIEPTAPIGTDERYAQVRANSAFTFISVVRGHWKPAAALRLAQRSGVVSAVEVILSTADLSGHGRGGYDRAYIMQQDGTVAQRNLTGYEQGYSDADDIHEAYDAVEGR